LELSSLPQVAPKLVKLSQSGVSEQDIINIAAIFEKYVAGKDRQSFVSELEHYGDLKSAIQELSMQYDKMRMEVSLLQTQNRDLNADNQRIVSSLVNSRQTFENGTRRSFGWPLGKRSRRIWPSRILPYRWRNNRGGWRLAATGGVGPAKLMKAELTA
jgi:hypothetical protein